MSQSIDSNKENSPLSNESDPSGFDREDITLISAYDEMYRLQSEGLDEQAAKLQIKISKWAREGGSFCLFDEEDNEGK